jgi:hypothetical protein
MDGDSPHPLVMLRDLFLSWQVILTVLGALAWTGTIVFIGFMGFLARKANSRPKPNSVNSTAENLNTLNL